MKNKRLIYLFTRMSWLVLLFASPLVFAIPPYFGLSIGENLSFDSSSCLSAAKKALNNDDFQKVVQYKGGATVFAAYNNQHPYFYKAFVKCLSESGVLVVVVVANVPKNARQKAESLRRKIQQYGDIKPRKKHTLIAPESQWDDKESLGALRSQSPKSYNRRSNNRRSKNGNKTIENWQQTLLNQAQCLSRAEMSLRDSGFYRHFDFDDDSVYGNNDKNYKGLIECVTAESLVFFRVTGSNSRTRSYLINQLEKNF
jgi:hypothetical protein